MSAEGDPREALGESNKYYPRTGRVWANTLLFRVLSRKNEFKGMFPISGNSGVFGSLTTASAWFEYTDRSKKKQKKRVWSDSTAVGLALS